MQLYYSPTSPYTRRVCAALLLLGLENQVQRVIVSPFDAPAELTRVNPLSQIPTLAINDGEMLCGSALITEYLIAQAEQCDAMQSQHWGIRNLAGIAEGIVDAALIAVLETRRPSELQSPRQIQNQQAKILRSVAYLEQQSQQPAGQLDSHNINYYSLMLGVALGYLDFRQPELDWRNAAPSLSAWYTEVREQDWLQQTQPPH